MKSRRGKLLLENGSSYASVKKQDRVDAMPLSFARILPISLFLALEWLALTHYSSSSLYWGDSAEFIVSSLYLDLAHPPGSPTYSLIGNLFTLLPLGPIAWKVNLASSTAALSVSLLLWILTKKAITRNSKGGSPSDGILALIPPSVLLLSPSFMRQALTAEVYMINAAFFLGLFILLLSFEQTKDVRYLFFAAFLGGLGLGNHAVLIVPLAVIGAACVVRSPAARNALIPILVAGIVGGSVYLYLPLRASQNLPLRTGEPISVQRIWNFVSDARSRFLKPPRTADESDSAHSTINFIKNDGAKLIREIPWYFIMVGFLGVGIWIMQAPYVGGLFSLSAFGTWFFFSGWQPDPWIPLFVLFSLGVGIFISSFISKIKSERKKAAIGVPLAILIIVLSARNASHSSASELTTFNLPAAYGRELMSSVPFGAPLLTEASWFTLVYTKFIEGYRDDIALLYQPRILFPYFFESTKLNRENDAPFEIKAASSSLMTSPDLESLSRVIAFISERTPIAIEPNVTINSYLHSVLILGDTAIPQLAKGVEGSRTSSYFNKRLALYNQLRVARSGKNTALWADTRHHIESLLVNDADLFLTRGEASLALELYSIVCSSTNEFVCSSDAQRNMRLLNTVLLQAQ